MKTPQDHQCVYGIKLQHPAFQCVIIKRTVSFDHLRSFQIGNTCADHVFPLPAPSYVMNVGNEEEGDSIELLSIHDGLILDTDPDFHYVEDPHHALVHRLKWGQNMTLDIWIPRYHHATNLNVNCIGYLLNQQNIFVPTQKLISLPSTFIFRDVVIECTYDVSLQRWCYQRCRKHKFVPNTVHHEAKILNAIQKERFS